MDTEQLAWDLAGSRYSTSGGLPSHFLPELIKPGPLAPSTSSQVRRIYEAIPSKHFCFLGSMTLLFGEQNIYLLKFSSLSAIQIWGSRRPPLAILHFYDPGGFHDRLWFLETHLLSWPWERLIWNINHSLVLSSLFTSNCRHSCCQIWTVVSEWGITESSWPRKEWILSAQTNCLLPPSSWERYVKKQHSLHSPSPMAHWEKWWQEIMSVSPGQDLGVKTQSELQGQPLQEEASCMNGQVHRLPQILVNVSKICSGY